MVDVEEDDADRVLHLDGAIELEVEPFDEEAVVVEGREPVGDGAVLALRHHPREAPDSLGLDPEELLHQVGAEADEVPELSCRDRPYPAVRRGAQTRRAGAAVEAGHLAEDVAGPHEPEDDGFAGRGRLKDLERPLHQKDDGLALGTFLPELFPGGHHPFTSERQELPVEIVHGVCCPHRLPGRSSISPWGRAGCGRYTGPDDRREPPGQGLRGPGAADESRGGQPPRPRRAPLRAPARHAYADPPDSRLRRDAGGGRDRVRSDRLGRGPRQDPGGRHAPARDGRRASREAPPGTRRSPRRGLRRGAPPRPSRPSRRRRN